MTTPEPERIPTELEALVQYLVNTFKYEKSRALKAIQDQQAPDELPAKE